MNFRQWLNKLYNQELKSEEDTNLALDILFNIYETATMQEREMIEKWYNKFKEPDYWKCSMCHAHVSDEDDKCSCGCER